MECSATLHPTTKQRIMKYLLITIFSLIGFQTIAQSNTIKANATLNNVTVFSTAAELNHSAKANIPSGNSEVIIKNVSGSVDENTIQVGSTTDLTILSVSFVREFLNKEEKSPEVVRLKDSLRSANNELEIIRSQVATQKNALSILDANKVVRGENTGLVVAELQKLVDYYIAKHKEITITVQSLQQKEVKQVELVNKLTQQLAERTAMINSGKGEIRLQVQSNTSANTTFNVSYLSYTAAWTPIYDLRTKDTKSPLKIVYKGNIVQNTGLDWNKVKLTLNTGNPSQSGTQPVLSTWFLNYYIPVYKAKDNMYGYQNNSPGVQNMIQSMDVAQTRTKDVTNDDGANDFTTVSDNAINTSFDIDLLYDILSDNKTHVATIKEYDMPVTYKYYTVPKMDKDAFLLAEISNWEELNLLPGEANIIFDGTHVGKSFINPNSTQDTLNISLGRDKKLVIKREKLKDYCSNKFIGGNKVHTITYEIKVKNTRKENINLLLKDQFPISSNKDITIEVLETTDAMRNDETGVLTWKLDIAPGETKKVRVSYTVKFPKDKAIGSLF
jgi:uncharacterized protein (TIGR02231 family)